MTRRINMQQILSRHVRALFLPEKLTLVLVITGCTAMNDVNDAGNQKFEDQRSAKEARAQLEKWIAPHSKTSEAIRLLELHGFSCSPVKSGGDNVKKQILCMFSANSAQPATSNALPPSVSVRWFVTLNSGDDGTVNGFEVARVPKDIGE